MKYGRSFSNLSQFCKKSMESIFTQGPDIDFRPFRPLAGASIAIGIALAGISGDANSAREAEALYIRGATEIASGRFDAARRDGELLIRLEPQDPRASTLLIDVDLVQGRVAQARAAYHHCAACNPEYPVDAITRDAVVRRRAAPFFAKLEPSLHEPYPDGPQPFGAVREAAHGRIRQALKLITPLVKAQPSRPDLRFYRAILLTATRRNADAVRDLAVAVVFRPALPEPGVPRPLDRMQQVALWSMFALTSSVPVSAREAR